MRHLLISLALAAVLLLVACQLSPEHSDRVRVVFDQLLAEGKLTIEQHAAIVDALTAGDWSRTWELAGAIGLSILGALTGVRIQRGSILHRKGLAPVGVGDTNAAT